MAEDALEEGGGDAGAGGEVGVGCAAREGDVVCEVEFVDGAEGDFVRALGRESYVRSGSKGVMVSAWRHTLHMISSKTPSGRWASLFSV